MIKPGPTATPMTHHLVGNGGKLTPVEEVSKAIVKAIQKGKPVAYVPGKWLLIMTVMKLLPGFLFNRLNI